MNKFINLGILFFFVLLIIPAVLPLFKSGIVVTDDGSWMIIRLSAFYDTLRDGQIPVRFLERLNFGYGYPVSNFLYPGYLYVGSVIHVLGFGFIETVKILFGLSVILSGAFSFLWFKRLFGNIDSLIGSIVYVYTPYHLFDIYRRGSLGEALSIAVLPLVFLGIEIGSTTIIALSVFLLLIFHNTLALLFLPLIPIYALVRKSFKRSFVGIILGGLMSSFFTIPAIYELRYTKFSSIKISNPTEYFADINLIGLSTLIFFVAAVLLSLFIYKGNYKKIPYKGLLILFSIISFLSVFLSSAFSSFIWQNINASFIQFPYRILSLTIISISFLAAFLSYILFSKAKLIALIIILGLTAFSGYGYLVNLNYSDQPEEFYSTNEATTTVHDEYMPKWVKSNPSSRPENKVEIVSGNAQITDLKIKSNLIEFDTQVESDTRIRVNTVYYPGWRVFVEGDEREIYYNEAGLIEFDLKPYDDRVYISFQEDLIRTLSNTLSILAALGLVYYIGRPLLKF